MARNGVHSGGRTKAEYYKVWDKEDGSNSSNDVVYSNDGKHIIFSVPGGDPYAQHGNFSIVTDLDGKNGRTYDVWDFGVGPFSSNNLFGTRKISTFRCPSTAIRVRWWRRRCRRGPIWSTTSGG